MSDLQASDLEVTEDGVAQRVDQLQFVRLNGEPPPGDDRSLEIRSQDQAEAEAARDDVRVLAIFLDDYHIDRAPAVMQPLRRALKQFVGSLWPTDLVALMDPLTPLSALEFTRNRSQLVEVIDKFEGRQGEVFPIKSPVEEAQLGRPDIERVRAEVTLSALAALVVRLGGLREGRKTILFVSQGPPSMFGPMGREGSLQDRMREISEAANRGNVTIYPYDPRSLGMMARGSRDTLYQLAIETGGRAITNTNDPTTGFKQILADTSAYYVLGYTPTRSEDDGKYHRIQVRVKRPGVHVLARQGYWAPAPRELEAARAAAARAVDPTVVRTRAAVARLAPTRHPAEVWVGWAPAGGKQVRVTVSWEPADPSVSTPASVLEVGVFDAQGRSALAPPQKMAAGDRHAAVFPLDPGSVALRFTARTADGALLDEWALNLEVPDVSSTAVALSTPRFYRAHSIVELRAIQASPDRPPDVGRRFVRTDRVVVAADCRAAAGGEQPTIEAKLIGTDGRELATLPIPPPDAAGVIRFELPIGSLGQGSYVLRLSAKTGAAAVEQLAAFSIAG